MSTDQEKVVIPVEKPTVANEPVVIPLSDVKHGLVNLPKAVLENFIGDVQDALAKKEGKTWSQWLTSLDKTKIAGWFLFGAMTLFTLWQSRNPPVPPPSPIPTPNRPIDDPKKENNSPSVRPFGTEGKQ